MDTQLITLIKEDHRHIITALKDHASILLDCNPRFRYFTLHGRQHIDNLFSVAGLLIDGGLILSEEQAFLLAGAICAHDLGMVLTLSSKELVEVFGGKPQPTDPANLEIYIRQIHHELIDKYIDSHFDFLLSLGLTPPQCAILRDISRCHRKINLATVGGHVRSLGALLRLIDELDTYPSRAPAAVLLENYKDMDATSCWHWFKHNICHEWTLGHNVSYRKDSIQHISFNISVHPSNPNSIPYWINQVRRSIYRVLFDEGTRNIILESWGVLVSVYPSQMLSSVANLGEKWADIEQKALSAGKKVILVIDDEVRKMEDLFLPLMQNYHIIFSPNAGDALDKLSATAIDFAIVDLQVGSGFKWSPEETSDFKMTGLILCRQIRSQFPKTKIGILTGSRHDLSEAQKIDGLEFLIRKPVDPEVFEKEVNRVLN